MMLRNAVSRRTSVTWLFLFFWTLSLLLCPSAFAAEAYAKALAKVGDRNIGSEDLQAAMGGSEGRDHAEKGKKIDVLKELVRIEVFSREARDVGLDRDEKLQKEIERAVNFYLAKEYVKRNIRDTVTVSKEEMQEHYRKHPGQFQTPEKMKVRQIFLHAGPEASAQESQKTRDLAEDLLRRIRGGEDFSKLSSAFSSDTMLVKEGGDLGFIARGAMAPEYQEAVFALKVGEISPVLQGEFGYSIFKNEGVTPAGIEPFIKVREVIEKVLREEKEDKKFFELEKNLFEKYRVEIWQEKL
jgi:parvulin-like peptidyl-prolyl isomerase